MLTKKLFSQGSQETKKIDENVGGGLFSFFGIAAVSDSSSPPSDIELLRYLADTSTDYVSIEKYPRIKPLFYKYNCPVPSSAPVERLFSLAGTIFSPKRTKLEDPTFEELLFCKANKSLF